MTNEINDVIDKAIRNKKKPSHCGLKPPDKAKIYQVYRKPVG